MFSQRCNVIMPKLTYNPMRPIIPKTRKRSRLDEVALHALYIWHQHRRYSGKARGEDYHPKSIHESGDCQSCNKYGDQGCDQNRLALGSHDSQEKIEGKAEERYCSGSQTDCPVPSGVNCQQDMSKNDQWDNTRYQRKEKSTCKQKWNHRKGVSKNVCGGAIQTIRAFANKYCPFLRRKCQESSEWKPQKLYLQKSRNTGYAHEAKESHGEEATYAKNNHQQSSLKSGEGQGIQNR